MNGEQGSRKRLWGPFQYIFPPPAPVEESVPLRLVTTGVVLVGIWAATLYMENGFPLALWGTVLTIAGSLFSWYRRYETNFLVKLFLFVAMLVLLVNYFRELLQNPFDTRAPLAGLLIWLQILHSFDLPARRDLNYSLFVGLILVGVAGSISRTLEYSFFFALFIIFGYLALVLEHRSAQGHPVISFSQMRQVPGFGLLSLILGGLLLLFFSLAIYLILPHEESPRIRSLPVSLRIDFPKDYRGRVINPAYEAALENPEGGKSLQVNPNAYFGFAPRVDLNYRGHLSREIVLRVRSGEYRYWRGMAFDHYTGSAWEMSEPENTRSLESAELPIRVPFRENSNYFLPYHELVQTFYIEADSSNLVMASQNPAEFYFPTYSLRLDRYGGFRSPIPLTRGMVYSVVSWVPEYSQVILRKDKGKYPAAIQKEYLQLPAVPRRVRELALEITRDATNPYDQASLIESYLKANFVYDLEVPPTPAGRDVADWFLFDMKRGYCESFASSMVVLCRSLGIPARFVTGFTPGKRNPVTGFLEVRSEDAHAWVEVYFSRYGWVPFDPTAGYGVPSAFTTPSSWSWGEKFMHWARLDGIGISAIRNFYHLWDQVTVTLGSLGQRLLNELGKNLLSSVVAFMLLVLSAGIVILGLQQIYRWLVRRKKRKIYQKRYPYLDPDGILALESYWRIASHLKKEVRPLSPRELMAGLAPKGEIKYRNLISALDLIEKVLFGEASLTFSERSFLEKEIISARQL